MTPIHQLLGSRQACVKVDQRFDDPRLEAPPSETDQITGSKQ